LVIQRSYLVRTEGVVTLEKLGSLQRTPESPLRVYTTMTTTTTTNGR
jgi:hypothetical protein